MITDSSTFLTTHYFAARIPFFSPDFYDYSYSSLNRPWYVKRAFPSLFINLLQSEEELMASYEYRVRHAIRWVQQAGQFKYTQHANGQSFYRFQYSVVAGNSAVKYYPKAMFRPEQHRRFTTIVHKDFGLMAFHGYILDPVEKIVLLTMNISDFRRYRLPRLRQIMGKANTYLFHRDFLYFQSHGYQIVDLGGYEEENLIRFKKGFGGEPITYFRYQPKIWVWLKKWRQKFKTALR